jgi:hypothetical protein
MNWLKFLRIKMNERDKEFRDWYDNRLGIKSELFAYDVWCAAWDKAVIVGDKAKTDAMLERTVNART